MLTRAVHLAGGSSAEVPTRYRRMPEPADSCGLLQDAGNGPEQALPRSGARRANERDCHGKEGVAGSSPAEGFENRAAARFSCFRGGSGDHFQRQGKGSPVRLKRGRPLQAAARRRSRERARQPSSAAQSARVPGGYRSVEEPPRAAYRRPVAPISRSFGALRAGREYPAGEDGPKGQASVEGAAATRTLRIALGMQRHVDVGREGCGQGRDEPPLGQPVDPRMGCHQPAPPAISATPLAYASVRCLGNQSGMIAS
jgi:hypothetical protein